MNVNIRYAPSFNTEVSAGKAGNRAVDRRQETNTWKKRREKLEPVGATGLPFYSLLPRGASHFGCSLASAGRCGLAIICASN